MKIRVQRNILNCLFASLFFGIWQHSPTAGAFIFFALACLPDDEVDL